ncbi:MAG: hypothetical protein PHQ40_13520 [Anaerolineaceae bacterium]|nr:hypothetical protein [Anaerolineaceae bacterium]
MPKHWLWLGMCLALVGCTPQPLTTPSAATPQVVRVQYSPNLRYWTQVLSACANREPDIALVVQEISVPAIDLSKGELALRIGAPDTLPNFSAPIGTEEWAVIVHAANPIGELTLDQVRAIFTGSVSKWEVFASAGSSSSSPVTGIPVQIWRALPGDDLGQAFSRDVLGNESISKRAFEAPSSEAMLEAVSQNPGAIGFVPRRWVNGSVNAVKVAGVEGILAEPVLVMANTEPQGAVRRLVACMQGSK